MNWFWKKCFCCKSSKDTQRIMVSYLHGMFFNTYYYHEGCLREVLCHPEKYSNLQISIAKNIVNQARQAKKYRKSQIKSALKLCNSLEEANQDE